MEGLFLGRRGRFLSRGTAAGECSRIKTGILSWRGGSSGENMDVGRHGQTVDDCLCHGGAESTC